MSSVVWRPPTRHMPLSILQEIWTRLTTAPNRRARAKPREPVVNLALQGGGAHGAFTWGVLDRLLEEPGFAFEGVSGTSAGAINAVVVASGWLSGGAEGAREALAALWRQVGDAARLHPQGRLPRAAFDLTAQLLSPYQLNPLGINPLKDLLARLVDFERLRSEASLKLFIAATNLRTGRARIFRNSELTIEVALASACLPHVHAAIEIDGEAYWDGGYVSNPPIMPLVESCSTPDLLLIQINPLDVDALPRSAAGIRNRVGEIVFGQPLQHELELLALRAARARRFPACLNAVNRRFARCRRHVIDGSGSLAGLDPTTKVVPASATLLSLRDAGRSAAEDWLLANSGSGRRLFLGADASFPPLRRSA